MGDGRRSRGGRRGGLRQSVGAHCQGGGGAEASGEGFSAMIFLEAS